MPPALLRLREFTVVHDGKPVFEPVNLVVKAGKTTIVHGINASGKTSLYGALLSCDPRRYRGRVQYDKLDLARAEQPDFGRFWSETRFVAEDAATELAERQLLGERAVQDARQLSLGARYRVAVEQALQGKPRLVVLDEAPDVLDELARQEFLHLLRDRQKQINLGILVLCRTPEIWRELEPEQIVELTGGRGIELDPERLESWVSAPSDLKPHAKPLLSCQSVSVAFAANNRAWRRKSTPAQALHAVNFELGWGQTMAVVGATPSGKSTLALALSGLLQPSLGRVVVRDASAARGSRTRAQSHSRSVQLCLDDPRATLDPRLTVLESLLESLRIAHRNDSGLPERANALLEDLGLAKVADHYPSQLSSGQACLLGLGRALSQRPAVLLLDNALAALGEPLRGAVLNLLRRRNREAGTSCILVTNDLTLAHDASDRLAVMYGGTMVEWGNTRDVFEHAAHPYSRALLSQLDHGKVRLQLLLEGAPPDPTALPGGCTFHPRCARFERGRCDKQEPDLKPLDADAGHLVACFRPHQTETGQQRA